MQGGLTPAGDFSPPNILEGTCIPDIQQSACSIIPSEHPTASENVDNKSTQKKNGRSATVLIVTHAIEITVMVTAVILRVIPQTYLASSSSLQTASPESLNSSSFEILPEIVGLHLCLLVFPFTIVTSISLAWVLRSQDFSGRRVARLVCWLLHFVQSSLIWRYLKIQIAFDPGDLSELKALRFIQVHIHTLPYLVMHVGIFLTFTCTFSLAFSLSIILILSVATTIVVSNTSVPNSRLSSIATHTIIQLFQPSLSKGNSILFSESKLRIYIGATTVCILWSRVIALAALFCVNSIWAIALILVHWLAAVIWLGFQEKLTTNIFKSFKIIVRRGFHGYLLLWDWHIFKVGDHAVTVCYQPQIPAIYYTIIATQNIAATSVWYISKRFTTVSLFYTGILTSVLVSQVVGLLLLSVSYLCFSSIFSRWYNKKNSTSISRKPSLVTLSTKVTASNPKLNIHNDMTLVLESPHYGEFSDFVENISVISAGSKHSSKTNENIEKKKLSSPEQTTCKQEVKSTTFIKSSSPPLQSSLIQPSLFGYTNDIIQQTTKSERSSTENGSFNSRNTNTLPAGGSVVPDYEVIHEPHGSFSDSFSSLSCGTVNKIVTSTPKGTVGNQHYPHNVMRLKHLKACQNSCCHAKRKERQCEEVKEEKNEFIEQFSLASLDKEIDPPKVAVVRATQRFQVVCTKCLNAHDPLLTLCSSLPRLSKPPSLSYSWGGELGGGGGCSSTGYPSDTEFTTTIDTLSSISADSHSTYTTWPVGRGQGMAKLLMLEKGGHDYVTAWLWHQQSRGNGPQVSSSSSRKVSFQNIQKPPFKSGYSTQNRPTSKYYRNTKRHGHRSKLRSPSLIQDLETIV